MLQAEAEGPHSEESSSSKTEPTLFSPNYEQMRHHKGLIGIGTYGRVEQCAASHLASLMPLAYSG